MVSSGHSFVVESCHTLPSTALFLRQHSCFKSACSTAFKTNSHLFIVVEPRSYQLERYAFTVVRAYNLYFIVRVYR